MEPDLKERKEFIYIPSHIFFHPANDTTPGVIITITFTFNIHHLFAEDRDLAH